VTWSIVARDPKTGELGIAVASGGPSSGERVPYVKANVGAVAAQGMVGEPYGSTVLTMLGQRQSPEEVINALVGQDDAYDQRQFHLINADGQNSAFTGEQCGDFAGQIVSAGVSVAGNLLAGPQVLIETLKAFEGAGDAPMPERLLAALSAGQTAGGDIRGVQSAGLTVVSDDNSPPLRFNADRSPDPIGQVRQLYQLALGSNQSKQGGISPMNSQYFPQMPQSAGMTAPQLDPFSHYAYMAAQQQTPEQRQKQAADGLAQRIMAQPAQNVGQGVGQLAAGLGMGLRDFMSQGQHFPIAPGGVKPSIGAQIGNFFTGRQNGGLF
jgi:uncharacterized Ntn-hydrolase superfamily protein